MTVKSVSLLSKNGFYGVKNKERYFVCFFGVGEFKNSDFFFFFKFEISHFNQ